MLFSSSDSPRRVPISDLLDRFVSEEKSGTVTFREFIERLGDRGFGLIILFLSLPNTPPLGIPGLSSICAVPIMFFSIQMMLGKHSLWLPDRFAAAKFNEKRFDAVLRKTIPMVRWFEKIIHPRYSCLTTGVPERLVGAMLFILAAIIFLPIPGGNFIPAFCMTMLALGLLNHDGLLVAVGMIAGAFTIYGMSYVILLFFEQLFAWL